VSQTETPEGDLITETAGIGAWSIELAKRAVSSVEGGGNGPLGESGPTRWGAFAESAVAPASAVGFFRVDLGLGWGGIGFREGAYVIKWNAVINDQWLDNHGPPY